MSVQATARFDAEAAGWDANPTVHEASRLALEAILARFPQLKLQEKPDEGWDVLELGCGTGVLSFMLAPYVRHITAVDSSSGMIAALEQKIELQTQNQNRNAGTETKTSISAGAEGPAQRIHPLCLLLEDPNDPRLPPARDEARSPGQSQQKRKYDLVISHLVLHHIPDLESTTIMLRECLKPGTGWMALTDYEDDGPQARRFHPEFKMEGVERHGIRPDYMETLFRNVGLLDVAVERAFTLRRKAEAWPGSMDPAGPSPRPHGLELPKLAAGTEQGDPRTGTAGTAGDGDGRGYSKDDLWVLADFPFLICMGRRKSSN